MGNIFLKTFQEMIGSLSHTHQKRKTEDLSVLDKQAEQIKDNINRLKYVSLKTEPAEKFSSYQNYQNKGKTLC